MSGRPKACEYLFERAHWPGLAADDIAGLGG